MLITYQSQLIEKKQLSSDVFLFRFSRSADHPDWTYKAGQYMIMHIPQADGHPARRLYSTASPPSQTDSLDFIIQILPNGVAGPFLTALNTGESITMQGPAGLFTFKDSPKEVIMLGTGTGIAPLYAIIKDQLEVQGNTNPFYLYFGLKTCQDLYLFEELKELAEKHENLTFKLCLSREELCEVKLPEADLKYVKIGRVTNGLEDEWQTTLQKDSSTPQYYVCGSKEVVESLRGYLEGQGIAKESVHFEKFT